MERLKIALENLDEEISALEDKVGVDAEVRREQRKRQAESIKAARAREAGVMAIAQKVASRLDWTIERVERVLKE